MAGACLLFSACSSESGLNPAAEEPALEELMKGAKKPAAKLEGTSQTLFTFTPPNFWNGSIQVEGMGEYGITFISFTPPRDYSNASPFYEEFIIFKLGSDWTQAENVLMKGWNKGLVKNAKYPVYVPFQANGKITEAYGDFAAWNGCNWKVGGLVNYPPEGGLPLSADGSFRLN